MMKAAFVALTSRGRLGMSFVVLFVLCAQGCSGGSKSGNNVCEGVTCSGHGVCAVADGEAVCACDPGYHPEGLSCIEDGTNGPCFEVDCSGHGTCVESEGTATCDCEAGFHAEGLSCVEDGTSVCDGVDCSGHGTCRVVDGAAQCDCEDGYHVVDAVFCEADVPENEYLEPVEIPNFDPNDPTHCIIPDDVPWSADTLNSEICEHFYVRPGTYSGKPVITRSGSEDARRTISPYDGSTLHPGKLADEDRTKIALRFEDASWWVVSRMSSNQALYMEWGNRGTIEIWRGSNNIIIDSMYFGPGGQAVAIRRNCHDNTVQRCFMDGVNPAMLTSDLSFIQLEDSIEEGQVARTLNTKIILNEFHNFKALRLQCHWPEQIGYKDFSGTIVDSNVVWFDGDVLCDADGTPNPNGDFAFAETGFGGVKSAAEDPNNPVIYSNNVLMGARQLYPNAPSTLSSPASGFTVTYFNSNNIIYRRNVVIDCPGGIALTSNHGGVEVRNGLVEDNIFYGCGFNHYSGSAHNARCTSMRMQATSGTIFRHNVVKDPITNWATVGYNRSDSYFGENTVINMDDPIVDDGPDLPGLSPEDTNIYLRSSEGDAEFPYDYVVHYYKYTNAPQTSVVPHVLRTPQQ